MELTVTPHFFYSLVCGIFLCKEIFNDLSKRTTVLFSVATNQWSLAQTVGDHCNWSYENGTITGHRISSCAPDNYFLDMDKYWHIVMQLVEDQEVVLGPKIGGDSQPNVAAESFCPNFLKVTCTFSFIFIHTTRKGLLFKSFLLLHYTLEGMFDKLEFPIFTAWNQYLALVKHDF